MYVTIINDCHDPLTMNRQAVRAATFFPATNISTVAVGNYADLEASGVIIDTIDAAMDEPGIIVGSSGYRDHRFIEIVVQGLSAAERFGIKVGDKIFV